MEIFVLLSRKGALCTPLSSDSTQMAESGQSGRPKDIPQASIPEWPKILDNIRHNSYKIMSTPLSSIKQKMKIFSLEL